MANTILTPDMITAEAMRVFENQLVLTRNVNRQYDASFAQEGAKIGTALRIRLPDRALVTDGAAIGAQDESQQYTTLNVSSQKHVALSFTSAELTMSIDRFSELIIQPRVSQLASTVDADLANFYKYAGQSVGTPGTTPATSAVLLAAGQKLDEAAVPRGQRYMCVNPAANAGLVEGMKGLFNPVSTVTKQFKSGLMQEGILGLDEMNMSQSIATHTTGSRLSGATVATTVSTQGATTLVITTSGAASQTVKLGDVFTVAACNAVNPQTRQSVGALYQFVVLADATASTNTLTVTVAAMYDATQALATMDALPISGAAVTWVGSASTQYPQNLTYYKDAVTFATADLILPKGMDMASRMNHNGISMRFIRGYDIDNDRMVSRLDVLYGWAVLRPTGIVRTWG